MIIQVKIAGEARPRKMRLFPGSIVGLSLLEKGKTALRRRMVA
jgi:hypothetical protein